jgi:FtsH-binding integral membrane protein
MAITTMGAVPVIQASHVARTTYLRQVAATTTFGLGIAGVFGVLSAITILSVPALAARWPSLIVILCAWGVANYLVRPLVFSDSSATRWVGFLTGAAAEGVAMGYLLLGAVLIGTQAGNPLLLVLEAGGLTGLTCLGMLAYLMTGPKELSMVGALMSALTLPMLLLMALTFIFPIGGPFGILISLVFVGISAGGLLYQINGVMHRLSTDMVIPGSYMITLGMLALFWNILVLLMRLNRR